MPDPIPPLTPHRRRLVDLCHRLGFGRIEGIAVTNGDPQFDPRPLIVTEVKLGAEHQTKDRTAAANPHPAVRDLLRTLDLVGNGTIRCLEIRHGLPFRIELNGELAA
jgi:hypothetical protein